MLFKLFRKIIGIEENKADKYETRILSGKHKPRIFNPDIYKADDNSFSFYKEPDLILDPEFRCLSCNVLHRDKN